MHDKNDAPDAHKTPTSTPTNLEAIDETRLAVGAAKQPARVIPQGAISSNGGRAGEGAGDSLPAESGERQGKSGLPFQIRAEDLIWGSQVI